MPTLRELIATKGFKAYPSSPAYSLDANDIEELLYDRRYEDYDHEWAHFESFEKAEKPTTFDLNTWTCTDTQVGLTLVCLDDTPVALIWQTARKSEKDIALLDADARDLLMERWEAHRPDRTQAINDTFLSDRALDVLINAPGEKGFHIDPTSYVNNLRLSAYGVAQWLESIGNSDGLKDFDTVSVLRANLDAAQKDLDGQTQILARYACMPAENRAVMVETIEAEEIKLRTYIDSVRVHLIEPLTQRLQDLGEDV